MQLVEGDTVEDPDNLKATFVNQAMNYMGHCLLDETDLGEQAS